MVKIKRYERPKFTLWGKNGTFPLVCTTPLDLPFLVLVLVLLSIGLIMLFSASHANAFYYEENSFVYIAKQSVFALIGIFIMFAVSYVNYKFYRYIAAIAYIASFLLVCLTRFMPVHQGARRWIVIGSFQFQPSEIAKVALVLFLAHIIAKYYNRMNELKIGIFLMLAIMGIMVAPIFIQPHLSATVIFIGITGAMMFTGGARLKHLFVFAGIAVSAILIVLFLTPIGEQLFAHAHVRLQYWLDPFKDMQGKGYQSVQSLYAIGSGGVLGVGLGESRQKYMYLPEVQNDFVFAIVCEELGFIGAAVVVILFAMLVWRGYVIAMKCRDKFGSLVVIGLVTQIGLQAFLNIAVVTNTLPNTGISLPFFSYGGTALVVMLAQIGIILGVSRQCSYEKV